MSNELQIVVIDDIRLSSHNLEVQLRFLGEQPLMTNSRDWKKLLSKKLALGSLYAILIGTCKAVAMPELVAAIHHCQHDLPIILTTSKNDLSLFPKSSKRFIVEVEHFSTNSELIKSLLAQAQNKRGASNVTPVDLPPVPSNKTIIKAKRQSKGLFRALVGNSQEMQDLRAFIQQVADNPVNILILGESGTGKEILARNLHYHSGRAELPFIPINCIAFSPERLELELFGCEAAHNSSAESRPGLFEKANGGTLFFDEVSDLPSEIQGKIMKFLESKTFSRVGGETILQSDVRIIASTNQDLMDKIAQGKFREDLYYRLNVIPVTIPALRHHASDIPDLVIELVARSEHLEDKSIRFNMPALLSLKKYPWPGNVRELMNLVERLSIIKPNEVIGVSDLPLEYQHHDSDEIVELEKLKKQSGETEGSSAHVVNLSSVQNLAPLNDESLNKYLANFEKHLVYTALEDAAGSKGFAAERLGIDDANLVDKIQQHNL